jgi:hypothetical protein
LHRDTAGGAWGRDRRWLRGGEREEGREGKRGRGRAGERGGGGEGRRGEEGWAGYIEYLLEGIEYMLLRHWTPACSLFKWCMCA